MSQEETYFVISNIDEPEGICFSLEEAKEMKPTYIEVFNKRGVRIRSYKYDNDTKEYTTNF